MSQEQKPNPDFEQRLLIRLKAVVAERGAAAAAAQAAEEQAASPSWRRRGPRVALGAVAVLTAAAAVFIFNSGGDNPPRAFAVEPREGGGVTIKVYSLEDASGLEQALEEAGIKAQVTWLPAGKVCREPHYTPSIVHLPGGGSFGGMSMGGPGGITIGIGSTKTLRESFRKHMRGQISDGELANINLDPQAFHPDQSVVLSGTPVPYDGDPEGGSITKMGVAEGRVEPCKPVPALPSGFGAFGLSEGGVPDYTPIGDEAVGQTAIAEALRRTATVAAASDVPVEAPPAAGQFLYAKTKVVDLQGWLPKGHGKGSKRHPRYFVPINDPSARYALVPTLKEVWTAPDGKTQIRESLGRVDFFSSADQRRWEDAGSPPPWAFDPSEHDVHREGSERFVKEFASKSFRGRHEFTYLSRLSQLPTEPEALRLAIEHRGRGSSPVDPSPADSPRGGATVERLLEILSEPITGPALRAAAFNVLAEMPGIGFERDVADGAGRRGDAIAWVRERGFGRRYIFDPHTSQILAEAEVIFDAKAAGYPRVPDDTVFRETAYLRSGIVDSAHETVGDAGGDPVATVSADQRN
ncbi:MAG: hypothetical protein ACRDLL_05690 [Solirubrobacterales bacterium]